MRTANKTPWRVPTSASALARRQGSRVAHGCARGTNAHVSRAHQRRAAAAGRVQNVWCRCVDVCVRVCKRGRGVLCAGGQVGALEVTGCGACVRAVGRAGGGGDPGLPGSPTSCKLAQKRGAIVLVNNVRDCSMNQACNSESILAERNVDTCCKNSEHVSAGTERVSMMDYTR